MQKKALPAEPAAVPHYVSHAGFAGAEAEEVYGRATVSEEEYFDSHMPNDVTREFAERMHYAAYRMEKARGPSSRHHWHSQYLSLRNRVVVGNHKLIYRAVRHWSLPSSYTDDMVGDCRVVLIQVVAAYNPWRGVRFSTYAFTCLMRALSRVSHRYSSDPLFNPRPLGLLPEENPDAAGVRNLFARRLQCVEVYLTGGNELLSAREKLVLKRRFPFNESGKSETLQQVGKELGLSKERVRQVQASALGKLREALLEGTPTRGDVELDTPVSAGRSEQHSRSRPVAKANFAGVGEK